MYWGATQMLQGAVLATVGLCSWASSGCATQCTLIACAEQVEIRFDEGRQLADELIVDVELSDGKTVTCTANTSKHTCSEQSVNWLFDSRESRTDEASTLEAGGKAIGVRVRGKHLMLKLRVSSATEVLVEDVIEPKYVDTEINGPGCGSCSVATESI